MISSIELKTLLDGIINGASVSLSGFDPESIKPNTADAELVSIVPWKQDKIKSNSLNKNKSNMEHEKKNSKKKFGKKKEGVKGNNEVNYSEY